MNPFDSCRGITATTVAERAGMKLIRKGTNFWTSCPMHEDKTPSLILNEKGHWYCFSCKRGGDAVALYATIHSIRPLEAAWRLYEEEYGRSAPVWHEPSLKPPEIAIKERVEEWYKEWWDLCCAAKHYANAILSIPEIGWDDPELAWAIDIRELAERNLDLLQQANPMEKVRMVIEVGRVHLE